ncbi:unnamed protein product [Rotaria magnacalcarata]|uniref:MULE transposase domain-containing protein n=1 Tax=Rotaria magnacalcarata TaxID=392030 RepID=A0A816NLC4_9BILA|nr:unnamed protein product [Rotaria magnacalcarata]
MPAIATIKNTLQKQRRKTLPSTPKSMEQLPYPLPEVYCKTKLGESFLLCDGPLGGVRSLVFSSYNDKIYLSQHENWYGDRTFYTCPSIFYQMHSIHTYYDGISTPCIFALLTGKNEQIYTNLFTSLFRKFVDLGLKTAYKNDENLREWFRSFAALSLLPLNHMLWVLQCLIRTRPVSKH